MRKLDQESRTQDGMALTWYVFYVVCRIRTLEGLVCSKKIENFENDI